MPAHLILAVTVNSTGTLDWVVKNIIPLIILAVGVTVALQYKSGRMSKIMGQVGVMLVGLGIIAGAALWYGFADTITHTIFA